MARYRVYIQPTALKEIDRLPGHVRSHARRLILALQDRPELPQSRRLSFELPSTQELRRVRLDDWRLIYLVDEGETRIYVLAVRRRPPYSYGDLASLIRDLGE